MGYKHVPRVTAVGPVEAGRTGRPCVNRNNPAGHSKTCPCRKPRLLTDAELDALAAEEDAQWARAESAALDAAVDRMREERHYGA